MIVIKQKNLELTFAQAEIRREVLKFNAGIENTHDQITGPLELQVYHIYIKIVIIYSYIYIHNNYTSACYIWKFIIHF